MAEMADCCCCCCLCAACFTACGRLCLYLPWGTKFKRKDDDDDEYIADVEREGQMFKDAAAESKGPVFRQPLPTDRPEHRPAPRASQQGDPRQHSERHRRSQHPSGHHYPPTPAAPPNHEEFSNPHARSSSRNPPNRQDNRDSHPGPTSSLPKVPNQEEFPNPHPPNRHENRDTRPTHASSPQSAFAEQDAPPPVPDKA